MKRCSKCILPKNYPNINFDEKGVCNVCKSFENQWINRDYTALRKNLEKLFSSVKKDKKSKYDCIVGVSGGKDSSYTAFICKNIFNLKILLVHVDNGFCSDTAKRNISRLQKKIDLDIEKIDFSDYLMEYYKHFLLNTGEFCTPCCRAIVSPLYKVAFKNKVPLIINGTSFKLEDFNRPKEIFDSSQFYFKEVIKDNKRLVKNSKQLIVHPIKKLFGGVKEISLPSYLDWNENIIYKTLKKELEWEGKKDHMDCLAAPIEDYIKVKKRGFGKKTMKFSSLIRDNQMEREDALKKIMTGEDTQEPLYLKSFLKKISVSREEFYESIKKSHLAYKT